ncbi:hypothetical protein ACLB2K_051066 [Fragaria x ananassa]
MRNCMSVESLPPFNRNWDWSVEPPFSCFFYGKEISKGKWFQNFNEGNTVEIQLPLNLFDSATWLGIAPTDMWSNRGKVSTELPQKLHKSKNWMGLALFVSLEEEVEQTMKEDNYRVSVTLEILPAGFGTENFSTSSHCQKNIIEIWVSYCVPGRHTRRTRCAAYPSISAVHLTFSKWTADMDGCAAHPGDVMLNYRLDSDAAWHSIFDFQTHTTDLLHSRVTWEIPVAQIEVLHASKSDGVLSSPASPLVFHLPSDLVMEISGLEKVGLGRCFISSGLYLFFFFSTVSICCCLLAFTFSHKQTPATPDTSASVTTNTEVIPSSSSSSSSPRSGKLTYDVFLSFRGEDTRKNFTDHLYTALLQKGIHTFRDDEELVRGELIAPNLLKAIQESRYVIVVFSPNYADSAWCLDEVAKVADCMKEMGTKVLPVFYHVDPSEVRRQTGEHFGKAFDKYQKRYKEEPNKVQRWKDSLFQVGNLSGWHLQDGSESKVIQEIVEKVFTEMNKIISTSEGLVGMDSHLNELFPYLNIGGLDVRIIGICGMGGIGKTTIAQGVFERLRAQFEGDSFLENVKHETQKQGSTIHLQEKLLLSLLNTNVNVQNTKMGKDIMKHRLSTKRVLVVLDDVDQDIQLETLCHRTWFGPGSRIIITSRDEHLISAFGADKVYMVNALTDTEAFDLFCLKAFNEDKIGEDFLKLSYEFLKYANGLPLAIKVLGSSVRGRNVKLWSSALKRLEKNPPKGIIDVLKVSFDGLEETEKKTFLDIACFFKGLNKDRVIRILDGCDDAGVEMDVQVLIDRSLVTLFGTKLWMHDLIQEMGREVVFQECREEPGKRSRLWLPKDIIRVLDQSKATSAVQSIFLQCPTEDDVVHSIGNAYSNMDRLRLLKISNVRFSGNIRYLSNELQYLEWHECPSDSFPSHFHPEKLVELHMRFSGIKQLWRGEKGWSMLRLIDLSGSEYLMSTPDFTEVPDLETLVLQDCTSLVEVHPSLGFLKKLVSLNMSNCKSIESIPLLTTLESLQIMRLSLCSGLKKFPEIQGNMKSLMELHLDGTSIEELPPSIEYLTGCSKIDEMPENLNGMKCLDKLSIGGTSIRELSVLRGMKNLQYLSCRGCKCLVSETCKESFNWCPRSFQSGETTVISLDSSVANFTDTTELHLTDLAFMKLVYSLWSDTTICVVLADEIPGWFSTVSTRNPISIRLTDDNNWKGIAACAVFSVKGHTTLIETDADSSNSSYQLTLETDVVDVSTDGAQWINCGEGYI